MGIRQIQVTPNQSRGVSNLNHSTHELGTVTVNDIVQHFYCPRKVYFLKTMQTPFKPRKKMVFGLETQEKEKKRVKERIDVYGFEKREVKAMHLNVEAYCEEIGLKGENRCTPET